MLEIVFGPEYRAAYLPALILLGGQVIFVYLGPVGVLLNMTGHENVHLRITVLAMLINFGLNALLIPTVGVEGAAISSSVTLTFWRVTGALFLQKLTGVDYISSAKD